MTKSKFNRSSFVAAARSLALELKPSAVTVDLVTNRLKAPKGSFYHRFESRDQLLGELWLETVLNFQRGFVAALAAGDGLAAALHTPAWSRSHLEEARLLLVFSRHDFVQGEWPASLREGVREQVDQFNQNVAEFSRRRFGSTAASNIRRATFVLAEVPIAAVKGHLQKGEKPPTLVDELIQRTYRAIVDAHP
jgi:AcrR family transcriptional regulator